MGNLPLWSIPCNAYKTNLPNLFFLTPALIGLIARSNCTGYRSIIALMSNSRDIQSTLPPSPHSPPPHTWSSLIFHQSTPSSSQIIPHQQRLLVCLSCCLECITSPSKRSTIPGALQTSPEDLPLQDTNMKPTNNNNYNIIIIIISTSTALYIFEWCYLTL